MLCHFFLLGSSRKYFVFVNFHPNIIALFASADVIKAALYSIKLNSYAALGCLQSHKLLFTVVLHHIKFTFENMISLACFSDTQHCCV